MVTKRIVPMSVIAPPPPKPDVSPFGKASMRPKRAKVFLWGDTGTGKTTTALQFPNPVAVDMEGGMDLYGDKYDFDVIKTTSADDAMSALDWLKNHEHEYGTVIIDPISVYWDALQEKWNSVFLQRKTDSRGFHHEFYDFQVKDWMTIKSEFKEFLRKLIDLDMHVVVTAREKVKYREGSFMVASGETFDGEKSLPYMFDTVVRLYVKEVKGEKKHYALSIKDRSQRLPVGEFECSYKAFERCFADVKSARLPK